MPAVIKQTLHYWPLRRREDTRDLHLTQTGVMVGTPSFMAPEQVRGSKDIDARADVYAAGVVLYICLTGERPFETTREDELFLAILEGRVVPLRRRLPTVAPSLETVVHRAMATRREDRFPTAAAMLAMLLHHVHPAERDEIPIPESIERTVDDSESTEIDLSMPARVGASRPSTDLGPASAEEGPLLPVINEGRPPGAREWLRAFDGEQDDPTHPTRPHSEVRRAEEIAARLENDTVIDPASAPYREAEPPSRSPLPPDLYDDED